MGLHGLVASHLAGTRADSTAFRGEAIGELTRVIGFDGWCWASVDPLTGVTTAGLADNPSMNGTIRQLFELEYGGCDVNGYPDLARHRQVGRLIAATRGEPARCRRWAALLGPRGVGDELRVTFADRGRSWGHLALDRGSDSRPFTAADARIFAPLLRSWAARHRHEVQAALSTPPSATTTGPEAGQAIVLLTAAGGLLAQSQLAGQLLGALPHRPGPGQPPQVVTALAAWLTARTHDGASPAGRPAASRAPHVGAPLRTRTCARHSRKRCGTRGSRATRCRAVRGRSMTSIWKLHPRSMAGSRDAATALPCRVAERSPAMMVRPWPSGTQSVMDPFSGAVWHPHAIT